MLELRPTCEHCSTPLPPDALHARICNEIWTAFVTLVRQRLCLSVADLSGTSGETAAV